MAFKTPCLAGALAVVVLLAACAERWPTEAEMKAAALQWVTEQGLFCMDPVTYHFLPERLGDPTLAGRNTEVREALLQARLAEPTDPPLGKRGKYYRMASRDRFCYAELDEVVVENWRVSEHTKDVVFKFSVKARAIEPWARVLEQHSLLHPRAAYANVMQLTKTAQGWKPYF